MKGKAQKRKWGDELEFKINSIELLSELKDKMAKHITLKFDYDVVDAELVDWIKELGKEKLGRCTVGFSILDRKNKQIIELKSREMKLNLTNTLIERLEANPKVEFSVN